MHCFSSRSIQWVEEEGILRQVSACLVSDDIKRHKRLYYLKGNFFIFFPLFILLFIKLKLKVYSLDEQMFKTLKKFLTEQNINRKN